MIHVFLVCQIIFFSLFLPPELANLFFVHLAFLLQMSYQLLVSFLITLFLRVHIVNLRMTFWAVLILKNSFRDRLKHTTILFILINKGSSNSIINIFEHFPRINTAHPLGFVVLNLSVLSFSSKWALTPLILFHTYLL